MKYCFIVFFCYLFANAFSQSIGTISSASMAGKNSFTVGDIFVSGETGGLGSLITITGKLIGVDDVNTNDDFIIFPNPFYTEFSIENKNHTKIQTIKILDASGKSIDNLQQATTYDGSKLVAGIYYIVIDKSKAIKLIKL